MDFGKQNMPDTPKRKNKRKHRSRRSERQTEKTDTGRVNAVRYPLLCFDTETTNHGELLELSVFDITGKEVYHKYFKPRAKKWPTDIHHISPEMVAGEQRFGTYRKEIGKLLGSTRYFVGCALSNDLANLRRHGVTIPKNSVVLDIQEWYWLLNDESDREDKHQSGLSTIADHYNLGFGSEHAHSATADTRLTLECFKALANHFDSDFPADDTIEPVLSADADSTMAEECLGRLVKRYAAAYSHAMQIHRMRNVAGFISVVRREQGYSLKYNRIIPPENSNVVFSVPVNDRIRAEEELRMHFEPIQLKGFTGIYDLTESDFEYISSYRNTINLESFIERQRKINKERKIARAITFRSQKRLAAEKAAAEKAAQAKASKQSRKSNKKPAKTSVARKAMRQARNPLQ